MIISDPSLKETFLVLNTIGVLYLSFFTLQSYKRRRFVGKCFNLIKEEKRCVVNFILFKCENFLFQHVTFRRIVRIHSLPDELHTHLCNCDEVTRIQQLFSIVPLPLIMANVFVQVETCQQITLQLLLIICKTQSVCLPSSAYT